MAYLRNTWYVAAWDHEAAEGQLLARRLLDEPVVLFRDSAGRPRALTDRCPHRFIPLSSGTLCGDAVRCAYHGLEFDGRGICTRNPHGDGAIPPSARVRSYPVVERHSVIWIWMGDASRADESLITDFSKSMDPASRFVGKDYLLARAHYQLEVDNILDLSHIEFLHGSTLGSDAVKHAETEVVQEGDTVYSRRLTHNEIVSESLASTYGVPRDQPVDRWLDVRFDVPAQMELWSGWAPAGTDDPRKVGKRIPFIHLFTPETETTTHYWFATSYPRKMGEEGQRRAQRDIAYLRTPFEREDLPILELQQRSMQTTDFWSLSPVLLAGDAAAVRARRVLEARLRAEQGTVRGTGSTVTPSPPRSEDLRGGTLVVRVARKAVEAADICSFELVAEDGLQLPPFSAGSHIDVVLPGGLRRQYSLCNPPWERHRYVIAVLHEAESRGGSRAMHNDLREGDLLHIGLPRNRFPLAPDATRSVLVAGGIGITPILSMAEQLSRQGSPFELHYAVRSAERLAFRTHIQASAFATSVRLHVDDDVRSEKLDVNALWVGPQAGCHVYVCGPAGLIEAVTAAGRTAGWPDHQIHMERFSPDRSARDAEHGFELELAHTGRVLRVAPEQSIVKAMRGLGLKVRTSCEQGVCGTCITRVLSGTPEHRDSYLTPEERARGDQMLICCSRSAGGRLVLDA